jgi:hypothetical protein
MYAWLKVALSFAAGAAAMCFLDQMVLRRRAGGLFIRQERLREQVRAQIGALVTHPDAIRVDIDGGLVRVSGHVLAKEADGLLSKLTQVPGVYRVHNALSQVHDASRFQELASGTQGEAVPVAPVPQTSAS